MQVGNLGVGTGRAQGHEMYRKTARGPCEALDLKTLSLEGGGSRLRRLSGKLQAKLPHPGELLSKNTVSVGRLLDTTPPFLLGPGCCWAPDRRLRGQTRKLRRLPQRKAPARGEIFSAFSAEKFFGLHMPKLET